MKGLRAGICFIVTIFMLFTVCVSAVAAVPFKDVKTDKWYYDEVVRAYDEGIMVGISKTQFAPDDTVTREMFVTALSRIAMHSVEEYEDIAVFDDVKADKWYSEAIDWAVEDGIVYGMSETEFGVGLPVTREQIASFATRFIKAYLYNVKEVAEPAAEFTDKPSDYAKDAVEFMRKTGIIRGKSEGRFAPGDNATRAECAAILLRIKDAISQAGFKIDLDAENVSQISIFCDDHNTAITVTDDTQIADLIEFLENAPIDHAEFIGHAVGWKNSLCVYDLDGDRTFMLHFTEGNFRINECIYIFETDYFAPLHSAATEQ